MMEKRKWWYRGLSICLAVVLTVLGIMETNGLEASAANVVYYPEVDGFANKDTLKGIQGKVDATEYGIQHSLFNLTMNDCIYPADHPYVSQGSITPFTFEGEQFYFLMPDRYYRNIKACNQNNISVSMVFLLAYDSNEPAFKNQYVFQPKLYYNPSKSSANYYAPAVTEEASKIYRAFFSWICEECAKKQMHIDNFILGNEANVPNQWNYTGTNDPAVNAEVYANAFYNMYTAVRHYTDVSRCSIAIDHTWQFTYDGQAIAAKDFLDRVVQRLNVLESDIDWCVSCHLYPAILDEVDIWSTLDHKGVKDYNVKDDSAWFIDGNNLSVMTNYIRNRYGEEHRVMLTEQGFTSADSVEWQAASLAYSYYAAMYDPMVDCFILNVTDESASNPRLNFSIQGKLAGEIYKKIGNGNRADQQWISDTVLPIMGYSSWEGLVPNYEEIKPLDIYIVSNDADGIVLGAVVDESRKANCEYRWLTYDIQKAVWEEAQDWVKENEWFSWKPDKTGDYLIQAQARVPGEAESETETVTIGYNYVSEDDVCIRGMCQMPYEGAGGGYLIGVETNKNPGQSLRYELLILDCTLWAEGKPAWVWSSGQCRVAEGNAFWAVWQPQYGYYWTLFRVFSADGNLIAEECYGFQNI